MFVWLEKKNRTSFATAKLQQNHTFGIYCSIFWAAGRVVRPQPLLEEERLHFVRKISCVQVKQNVNIKLGKSDTKNCTLLREKHGDNYLWHTQVCDWFRKFEVCGPKVHQTWNEPTKICADILKNKLLRKSDNLPLIGFIS